jgi:hypothetical protein
MFKTCEFYRKYIIYNFQILYKFAIMRFIRKMQSSKDIVGKMVKLSFAVNIV